MGSVALLHVHYCTHTDSISTETAIFVSLMCSLLPEDLHLEYILKLQYMYISVYLKIIEYVEFKGQKYFHKCKFS